MHHMSDISDSRFLQRCQMPKWEEKKNPNLVVYSCLCVEPTSWQNDPVARIWIHSNDKSAWGVVIMASPCIQHVALLYSPVVPFGIAAVYTHKHRLNKNYMLSLNMRRRHFSIIYYKVLPNRKKYIYFFFANEKEVYENYQVC